MNKRISGTSSVAFIIEDEEGEIFGYYCNTEIIGKYTNDITVDDKSFQFNLQSKDNRLSKPMKFAVKDFEKGGIKLNNYALKRCPLICFGEIVLYSKDAIENCNCYQNENYFDYHGIENALCGKSVNDITADSFIPKRLFIIQME